MHSANPESSHEGQRRPPLLAEGAGRVIAFSLVVLLVFSSLAVSFHHHPAGSGTDDLRCGLCNLAHGGGLAAGPADAAIAPRMPVLRASTERPELPPACRLAAPHDSRAPPAV